MISVVNSIYYKPDGSSVFYVGRSSSYNRLRFQAVDLSILGNPFFIDENIGHNREWGIAQYRLYLPGRINYDEEIRRALRQIIDKARNGDVSLACWCKPRPCHADFIKELCERKIERLEKEY